MTNHLVSIGDIRPAQGEKPAASKIYRNIVAKDGFPTALKATTLHELFQNSVKEFGNEKLLGWRPIDEETGKAGAFQWLTYSETNVKVSNIASGLDGLGLTAGDRVGVYGMNCCEWMIAMQVWLAVLFCSNQLQYMSN